jgi:hypothetical protein
MKSQPGPRDSQNIPNGSRIPRSLLVYLKVKNLWKESVATSYYKKCSNQVNECSEKFYPSEQVAFWMTGMLCSLLLSLPAALPPSKEMSIKAPNLREAKID